MKGHYSAEINKHRRKKFIQIIYNFSKNLRHFPKKSNYQIIQLNVADELGLSTELIIYKYERKYSNAELNLNKNVKVFYYRGLLGFLKHMIKNKNAIIYANTRFFLSYLCCLFGKPNIFMNHDSVRIQTSWKRLINNFFQKRFDFIRVINDEEKKILLKYGIKEKNIVVLPLVVDYEFFKRKRQTNKLRKKYGIPLNKKTILFLANFHPDKDPYTVLRAFAELLLKYPNVVLILVGRDKMESCGSISLKRYCKMLGISSNVIFIGYLPKKQLSDIYSLSDVFVHSSISEGQCLTVFEAASAELPLCLSNIPSFYPLFRRFALFHDVGDHKKLADNMLRLINNKKLGQKLSRENLDFIKKKYNYTLIKSKLKEFIWKIANC